MNRDPRTQIHLVPNQNSLDAMLSRIGMNPLHFTLIKEVAHRVRDCMYRSKLPGHKPYSQLVLAGLVFDCNRVEIELTAHPIPGDPVMNAAQSAARITLRLFLSKYYNTDAWESFISHIFPENL